jgi:hypothetical protein
MGDGLVLRVSSTSTSEQEEEEDPRNPRVGTPEENARATRATSPATPAAYVRAFYGEAGAVLSARVLKVVDTQVWLRTVV